MADEVTLTAALPGTPDAELAAWRAQPPVFLEGFRLVDESYESLVYERDVMSRTMKVLMWGQAKTLYRVTVTFRRAERFGTTLTLIGQLPEAAREDALAWADSGNRV